MFQDINCLTVLSADRTWREDNGKIGMVGIFETLNVVQLPTQVLPFCLYVRLADVLAGKHTLVTNVISEIDHSVLVSVTVNFVAPQDSDIFQIQYPVPPLLIQAEGVYSVHIGVNGVQLAKHPIKVSRVDPPQA